MTATAVGPIAWPQSLALRTLLQQKLSAIVKQKQRKRAVQDASAIMTVRLGEITDFPVIAVNENQRLAL
jgi:hypothetical protein